MAVLWLPAALAGQSLAPGFSSIFDGKSLDGWDGDPAYWRVASGTIVGETKPGAIPKQNTFLIWRGGSPADFELRAEYRLTGGNSGIQYRSTELPDLRWAMKGYQADIDAEKKYTGQIYEERGRGFLALRGQCASIEKGGKPAVLGSLGGDVELKAAIHAPGWNEYSIIARGNVITQILNGRVMSILIDDDAANRKMDGLIGIQLHAGEPMKIEVRNIRLRPARLP
jgi:Domain of Unknown Function (DUF1080)